MVCLMMMMRGGWASSAPSTRQLAPSSTRRRAGRSVLSALHHPPRSAPLLLEGVSILAAYPPRSAPLLLLEPDCCMQARSCRGARCWAQPRAPYRLAVARLQGAAWRLTPAAGTAPL
jgi:hypothetical protein